MDKIAIQKRIDKNRELINRALNNDLSPVFLKRIVTELSESNEKLIKKLKE